ncbi:ABC transporter ATP-binding protein [Amorphoplanes nipponensis]|uniref:Multidrug ABC transporter ATP-binding protein n=1 Tax=Actinoplanes nipponensis TaxID=135950 RepID=A0A919JDH3_9ACTN|nr:ABC transporter ATP-binding protein [Actinoplanes nipponensis]GIE47355.1 multidrug ABC transporter ATP-binding protein [Actinoplanes nipponensis]
MTAAAIETHDLRKSYAYGPHTINAVNGIDLLVRPGRFFGLLGPNGAGKSTTIGMLTTRIRPTGGRAVVAGVDVQRNPVEVRRRVAVVTQRNTMDRQISVLENLEFRGRYFGLGRKESRRRALALLEEFGIADKADASLDEVSGGQARRAMICRAVMHRPEVLVLDEPSAGVDPQTRLHLWELLGRLHAEGQTVLLTTHHLEEAETLCDRIAIIDHGRVVAGGTVDEIKTASGAESVFTVVFDGEAQPAAETAGKLPDVSRAEADGRRLRVHAADAAGLVGELASIGADHGLSILDVSTLRPSLEAAFLNLTGREYRE